jgi:hypothetical protein
VHRLRATSFFPALKEKEAGLSGNQGAAFGSPRLFLDLAAAAAALLLPAPTASCAGLPPPIEPRPAPERQRAAGVAQGASHPLC